MNRIFVQWGAWCAATIVWTALLTLPINAPVFGDTEEMRTLTRLILTKGAHLGVYAVWAFVTGAAGYATGAVIVRMFF